MGTVKTSSEPFTRSKNVIIQDSAGEVIFILKLDISPAKGDRSNPGQDSRIANKRLVQEPNVHSTEEAIFILKLEEFIVRCVVSAQFSTH